VRIGPTVRRGVRWGVARLWVDVRPGGRTDLHGHARGEAPRDGSTPRPEQRFVPATTPTGPWADVDPLVAPPWPSRVWSVVGLRVWRAVRAAWPVADPGPDEQPSSTPSE
jgi:hypothetical protein